MNNYLAKTVSIALHPIFIPTYLVIILNIFAPNPFFYSIISLRWFLILLAIIFFYSAVFPAISIAWMNKKGMIENVELSNLYDRPKTYFIVSGFYIALSYFLYTKTSIFAPTAFVFAIIFVNIIGLGLISMKEQISAHLSAFGGLIGILSTIYIKFHEVDLLIPILVSILLAGIVASARLKLNAHNLFQVVFGLAWGLFCGIFGIILLF